MNTIRKEGKPIGADAYELRVHGSMDNADFEKMLLLRLQVLQKKTPDQHPSKTSTQPEQRTTSVGPKTFQRIDGGSHSGWATSPLERKQSNRKSKKDELKEKRTRRF